MQTSTAESDAKKQPGTVVETMSGATLRGGRRSGPGGAWAQYIRSRPEGAQGVLGCAAVCLSAVSLLLEDFLLLVYHLLFVYLFD